MNNGDPIAALSENLEAWIDTLESLDHTRAPLYARYGPGGTFDHERNILLSTIKDEYRQGATTRISQDSLDDMGHSDERYVRFIDHALAERTQLAELDATRIALEHRIESARARLYLQGRLARLGG